MHKAWLFATSFRAFQALASECGHTQGSHVSLQGLRDEDGNFCSRASAEYPSDLAVMYVEQALPLFETGRTSGSALPLSSVPLLSELQL